MSECIAFCDWGFWEWFGIAIAPWIGLAISFYFEEKIDRWLG